MSNSSASSIMSSSSGSSVTLDGEHINNYQTRPETVWWIEYMSSSEAQARILAENPPKPAIDVPFHLRGDRQDYLDAAEQVLVEIESGTYQEDSNEPYEFTLPGVLRKMVDTLVKYDWWEALFITEGDEWMICAYLDRQTGEFITIVDYLRRKGVSHFAAQFECFLHKRAHNIKARRLARERATASSRAQADKVRVRERL